MNMSSDGSPPATLSPSQPAPAVESSASFGLKKLITLLVFAALILPLIHFTPLGDALANLLSMRDRLDGTGIQNELKFFVLASVLMAAGAPRLMFFALAGLLFGLLEGFVAAMCASLAGSLATFWLVRWAGRSWVTARLGRNRFFRKVTGIRPSALSVFFVRQLPVSNVFINATLALSSVRSRSFALGSLMGFAPQGLVALLIGSGVSADLLHEGALQLVGAGLALCGFSFWVWRWKFGKRSPSENEVPLGIRE
jgi:uncharacterized membrane protein YdjX (TVP38/TMEM64 family)